MCERRNALRWLPLRSAVRSVCRHFILCAAPLCAPPPHSRAVTSRGEASSVNSELIIHEADDTTPRRRSKQEAWLIKVRVVKLTEVKLFELSK